jgi:hypothetical protein
MHTQTQKQRKKKKTKKQFQSSCSSSNKKSETKTAEAAPTAYHEDHSCQKMNIQTGVALVLANKKCIFMLI